MQKNKNTKRLVIKIGSHLLTATDGNLNLEQIDKISAQLAQLFSRNYEPVLVTSGAIITGAGKLGQLKSLNEKQALAAVGQPILMKFYESSLVKFNIPVAQVLLTRDDFENHTRYINAKNTLLTLIRLKVLPIVNENDTVAVEEIQFGDNDTLSALVATNISADILIILTDVEGLFTADPTKDKTATCIHEVKEITPQIEMLARRSVSFPYGTGGMYTKVQAAKITTSSGIETVIADGRKENVIIDIIDGKKIGTRFLPTGKIIKSKKRWIAFRQKIKGKIIIDNGAAEALTKYGKSLLPSGIISIHGSFSLGDTVSVVTSTKKEIARGITNFTSEELLKIKGKKSNQIAEILGRCAYEEVIHRDNLVLLC